MGKLCHLIYEEVEAGSFYVPQGLWHQTSVTTSYPSLFNVMHVRNDTANKKRFQDDQHNLHRQHNHHLSEKGAKTFERVGKTNSPSERIGEGGGRWA